MFPTIFTIPGLDIPLRSYGLMLMIGFVGGTWWATRRAIRTKGDPDVIVNMGFLALIFSILGARIFFVLHYWERDFAGQGLWKIVNLTNGGLEFYGGFIGGTLAILGYLAFTGRSLRWYLDIVTPSLMFGMCMARIGCFLNGCCWGGVCQHEFPWAVEFPYASPAMHRQWEERKLTLPQEAIYVRNDGGATLVYRDFVFLSDSERAKIEKSPPGGFGVRMALEKKFDLTHREFEDIVERLHTLPVHPSQLYASTGGILLGLMLNAYFYQRKRHGMVAGLCFLLYPIMRYFEEAIRADNPLDTAGMTISQFVSVVLFLGALAWIIGLQFQPLRSPRAVPFDPPWLDEKGQPKGGKKGGVSKAKSKSS